MNNFLDRLRGRQSESQERQSSHEVPLTRASRIAVPMLAAAVIAGAPDKAEAGVATVDTSTMHPTGLTFVSTTGDEAPMTVSFCKDTTDTEYYYFVSDDAGTGIGTVYYSELATEIPTVVGELAADDIMAIQVSKDCSQMWVYESGVGSLEYTYTAGVWTLTGSGEGDTYDEINDRFYWHEYTDSYYDQDIYSDIDGNPVSGANTSADEQHPNAYGDQLLFHADNDIMLLDMSTSSPSSLDSSGDVWMPRYQSYYDGIYSGYITITLCDGLGSYDGCDSVYWETTTAADGDDDGYGSDVDCNDANALIYPGATETAGDGVDSNCDGEDDPTTSTWYRDADSDGYGDPSDSTESDTQPSGYVADNTDCDDTNYYVNPSASENPYDGVDNDCDDTTLDDDLDGDGYNYADDCDDTDQTVNVAPTWYQDADSDSYGDPSSSTQSCTQPSGYVADNTDCDDSYAATNPGATEICDGYDNDCDDVIPSDEDDADGDGFMVCEDDCDDTRYDVNPDQAEQCDDIDHDCDGTPDNDITYQDWYLDADGDGYGDPLTGTSDCVQPTGYVLNNQDCDDTNFDIKPGVTEVYDEVDNDCNGLTDLEDPGCEIIWTDCEDMGSSKSVADVFMLPMIDEECTMELLIGTSDEPAIYTLDPGTSLDMFFEGLDAETGYYAIELYEGSHITYESSGTETDDFTGADGYFFGHSGSGYEMTYQDGVLSMTTLEPTITLFEGDVWEEGRDGLTQLTDYTCTETGDKVVVDTEAGTIEMNPEDNPDDTGIEPDDTGEQDTGIIDPPGGCEEGCSSAQTPEGALAATALAAMAVLGAAARRREED